MSVDSSLGDELREPTFGFGEVSWIWVRHLSSLLIPFSTLAFLWTGPHAWYIAPFYLIPSGIVLYIDSRVEGTERRQPIDSLPAWPFDVLVYILAALQLFIIFELASAFQTQTIFSIDMLMVLLLVLGACERTLIPHPTCTSTAPRIRSPMCRQRCRATRSICST